MTQNTWETLAANILKAELAKRGMKYNDLEAKLAKIGVEHSSSMIRQKIFRGSFTFAFLLQCLKAMDVQNLSLLDYFQQIERNE